MIHITANQPKWLLGGRKVTSNFRCTLAPANHEAHFRESAMESSWRPAVALLADRLWIAPSSIAVVSGHGSPDKAEACESPSHMASEHLRLMQRCGLFDVEKEGRCVYSTIAEPHLANIMACIEARFGGPKSPRTSVPACSP